MAIDIELKKKIGQMFMCGFDSLSVNQHVSNLIEEYYLGNIILFSRNLNSKAQVTELNKNLSKIIAEKTGYEPLISIDEEGGSVSRLRNINGEFLGHYALGNLNDSKESYNTGKFVGCNLKSLGINMNLAPVADINSNPENIGIGIRSFGDNAELVTDMALSMYRGYVDSGVLPTIKHFPGLGDIAVDSHHDLPILYKTLDELKKQELIPYLKGINNCVESIMVSHILVHELDKEYPASMSKAVITDLLKTELGYNGLIMTDCFEMGAIQKNYGTGEAVVIALNAGIDLFDISHSENLQTEAFEAVYRAVENGTISKERIEESYNKIIAYKKSQVLETSKSEMPDLGTVYKRLLNTNIVENKLDDIENTIALAVNQFSSNPAEDEIVNPVNISSLFESLTNIKTLEYNVNDSIETLTNLATEAKDYKNVIVFVGDIDIYKNQIELLKKLSDKNVYLIDMRLKTTNVPIETKAYIKAYSYTDDTVKLLCEFLKEKLI